MKRKIIIVGIIVLGIFIFDFVGTRAIIDIRFFSYIKSPNTSSTIEPDTEFFVETDCGNIAVAEFSNDTHSTAVILLHGIRSSKESLYRKAVWLKEHGYNAFCIDLRAHGKSKGNYCTFGYYEKEDVCTIIREIKLRNENIDSVGIWGQSLGGAVALQTLAQCTDCEFGIVESTFGDLRTIIHDYFKRYTFFDFYYPVEYLIWRAEHKAAFSVDDVSPAIDAKNIAKPVLYIHGTDDSNIAYEYGEGIFDSIASNHKMFVRVSGAGHNDVWAKWESLYPLVESFLANRNSITANKIEI